MRQQRLVPGQGLQVEQLGARSVGHIASMHRAARQIPQQPGIHRAQADLARLSAAHTVRDMLQQPAGLAGREHGVDGQPGQAIDRVGQAALAQLGAEGRAAMALPGDARAERLARGALPGQHGFALVGDRQRGQLPAGHIFQDLGRGRQRRPPDLPGILLDPGRLGIGDGNRARGLFDDAARLVHQEGFRVGGALVEGEDEFPVGCCS